MFIRRTNTRNGKTGEEYFTFRLVETARIGGAVRQRTLLNLGAHFDLAQAEWVALAARIDELLRGQASLVAVSPAVEALAQRYAARMVAWPGRQSSGEADPPTTPADRFQDVDIETLELVRPRCVGVEHAALTTLRRLGIEGKLVELGFSKPQIAAAVGNIIGRMAAPASELATFAWLRHRTGLGELIGYDF